MKKITAVVLALGIAGALVVGCGLQNERSVTSRLNNHAEKLDDSNYFSTAMMTVQMENSSQTYYVETSYESPDTYRIKLGDQNKNIHQIIIHNDHGMFVVSPSLGKVFRFTGNWAQNQGHIYLYDQVIQQILQAKHPQMTRGDGTYTFTLPVTPATDVVVKEKIALDQRSLNPTMVTLLDKDSKPVVTMKYESFKTGVKFSENDFNPQAMLGQAVKTTSAASESFGYVIPSDVFNDKLLNTFTSSNTDITLRYTGAYPFALQETRPTAGDFGVPDAELVDLYGVPGWYEQGGDVAQLTWINDDVQYSITSQKLSLNQMESVATSMFGQVGK